MAEAVDPILVNGVPLEEAVTILADAANQIATILEEPMCAPPGAESLVAGDPSTGAREPREADPRMTQSSTDRDNFRHDRLVEIEVPTRVAVEIRDESAITRITGPEGDEWRSQFYNLRTEQDVFEHFAYNAAKNGVTRANQLDGWGDLDDEAVRLRVLD